MSVLYECGREALSTAWDEEHHSGQAAACSRASHWRRVSWYTTAALDKQAASSAPPLSALLSATSRHAVSVPGTYARRPREASVAIYCPVIARWLCSQLAIRLENDSGAWKMGL